jgi:hypothetical protein
MTTLAANPLADDQPAHRIPRRSNADWPLRWLLIAFVACVVVYGCKNLDPASRPQDDTAYAERSITKISDRADVIEDNADVIQKRTPRASLLRIIENVQAIKFNAGAIREDVADGLHALGEANKKIAGLQASNATLTKELDEAREQAGSWQRRTGGAMVTLGMVLGALGVMAFVYGQKWGKAVAAGSLVLVVGGTVIALFAFWIGLAAVVVAVVCAVAYVWTSLHKTNVKLETEYKATDVMAERLSAAKQAMAPEKRAKFFGVGAYPGDIEAVGLDKGAADPKVRATIKESVDAAKKATPLVVSTTAVGSAAA